MSELESSNVSQALAFAASRPGLILPANKGPSELQWLCCWSSAPVLCSSVFPGCYGE